jgi:pimeloyl-ACP methyl ester carboxylesterase
MVGTIRIHENCLVGDASMTGWARGLDVTGRHLDVSAGRVFLEESGGGSSSVVFEAGLGFGRTSWDPVVPLLADAARLVAYDRPGHGRSDSGRGPTSIEEMSATLCQIIDSTVGGNVVLVAHSMGGLIARQAATSLGPRLAGLVLVDPTPETAAMFDDVTRLTRRQGRLYGLFEAASHVPPLRGVIASMGTRSFRDAFSAATYATIQAEDYKPSSFAQMRREAWARAAAVVAFRREPPSPPHCPVILLSANRAVAGSSGYLADIQEHQRRYVDTLDNGRFELVDAAHVVQAEQPEIVAARVRELLLPAG